MALVLYSVSVNGRRASLGSITARALLFFLFKAKSKPKRNTYQNWAWSTTNVLPLFHKAAEGLDHLLAPQADED